MVPEASLFPIRCPSFSQFLGGEGGGGGGEGGGEGAGGFEITPSVACFGNEGM